MDVDFKELLIVYNVCNVVYVFGDVIDWIYILFCGGGFMGVCDLMKINFIGELLFQFLVNVLGLLIEEFCIVFLY